jgi:hypothetical protein
VKKNEVAGEVKDRNWPSIDIIQGSKVRIQSLKLEA